MQLLLNRRAEAFSGTLALCGQGERHSRASLSFLPGKGGVDSRGHFLLKNLTILGA